MIPPSQLHTSLPPAPFGDGISDGHTYVVLSEEELQAEAFELYRTNYMTDYNTESAEVYHEFKLRVSIYESASVTTDSPQTIRSRIQQLWATIRNIYFIETDAERHARVTAQLRLEIAELTARLKRSRSPDPLKPDKHPKYDEENKG